MGQCQEEQKKFWTKRIKWYYRRTTDGTSVFKSWIQLTLVRWFKLNGTFSTKRLYRA